MLLLCRAVAVLCCYCAVLLLCHAVSVPCCYCAVLLLCRAVTVPCCYCAGGLVCGALHIRIIALFASPAATYSLAVIYTVYCLAVKETVACNVMTCASPVTFMVLWD